MNKTHMKYCEKIEKIMNQALRNGEYKEYWEVMQLMAKFHHDLDVRFAGKQNAG
jgi:hypothetical protein